MEVLLLSGLGMTIAGGSYPASQAEHMIAHAYNMLMSPLRASWRSHGTPLKADSASWPRRPPLTLHGEEVAVTALAMARRQEALLGVEPIFADRVFPEAQLVQMFGEHVTQEAKKAYAQKVAMIIAAPSRPSATLDALRIEPVEGEGNERQRVGGGDRIKNWPSIAEKIEKVTMKPPQMQTILEAAECNTSWARLGWEQEAYLAVSGVARFLRERFTFLDLI